MKSVAVWSRLALAIKFKSILFRFNLIKIDHFNQIQFDENTIQYDSD